MPVVYAIDSPTGAAFRQAGSEETNMSEILGLHHVTASASDPQKNIATPCTEKMRYVTAALIVRFGVGEDSGAVLGLGPLGRRQIALKRYGFFSLALL